ncbi:MAG TPA: hypothetical protein DEG47_16225 [Cyanobacteria bacterium UBA11148]|nr:hypothetical protein [Cyanobacteria bacterium UBA11148]
MLNHHLKIAECIVIIGSVIGWAVAVASGQFIYGVVPLLVALVLNLINRLRFEQQIKHRLTAAIAQLHRQVSQESQSVYQQQFQQAISSLQTKLPEYLAQIETSDSPSKIIKIRQLEAQLTSIEQSLRSVIDYLNSASLAARVEHLEQAIATATADISAIHSQLSNIGKYPTDEVTKLPTNFPLENVSEPSLFPVNSEAISEQKINLQVIVPTWSELHTLQGHSDWVSSLVLSSDNQILASGSLDHTIKVWNLSTGETIYTLCDHLQGVLCLVISPDGGILASGSFDQTIKLWSLDTGELLHTLTGHMGSVRSLVITPDSQTLISASYDQMIKLWRLDSGEFLGNLVEDAGRLTAIALTPDGQILVSGGGDGIVTLWQLDPPDLLVNLTNNLSSICSLSISPDGQTLAAGYIDGTLNVWQLSTAELLKSIQCYSGSTSSVIFSVDEQILIGGSAGDIVKIWHLKSDKLLNILNLDCPSSILSMAISPNGQWIVAGSRDGTVKIWQRD